MTKGERFSVDVKVLRVFKQEYGGLAACTGEDFEGYEVRWTTIKRDAPEVGEIVTVMGHQIHAYSGEAGPWAKARVPAPLERDKR